VRQFAAVDGPAIVRLDDRGPGNPIRLSEGLRAAPDRPVRPAQSSLSDVHMRHRPRRKARRRRSSAEEPSDSRQIRALASALGLRITFDDDGLPVIPGRTDRSSRSTTGLSRSTPATRGYSADFGPSTACATTRPATPRCARCSRPKHWNRSPASLRPAVDAPSRPRKPAAADSNPHTERLQGHRTTIHGRGGLRVERHTHAGSIRALFVLTVGSSPLILPASENVVVARGGGPRTWPNL
jgi:hypothetical protein